MLTELIEEGLVTLTAKGKSIYRAEQAKAILAVRDNWTLPWEPGGAPDTGSDAYGVSLTPAGEELLRDLLT